MEPSEICKSSQSISSPQEKVLHPRTVLLTKDSTCGFGFTLRHFIVYPPSALKPGAVQEDTNRAPTGTLQWKADDHNSPMDTIFIREVSKGSPADETGLHKGDRIIAINNQPVTGKTYSDIIHLIRSSGNSIKLLVVPKEDDILQLYFASSAYQPVYRGYQQHKYFVPSSCCETKQQNKVIDPPRNSNLSDERTIELHKAVGECDCQNNLEKIQCQFSEAHLLHEQKKKQELFYAEQVRAPSLHETHKRYLVKKDPEFPVSVQLSPSGIDGFGDDYYLGPFFPSAADTEKASQDVSASDNINIVQSIPNSAHHSENSIHDQHRGNFDNRSPSVSSFASQTDVKSHYISSGFGMMADCDNKPKSGSSCVAALISSTVKGLVPQLCSFHADQYFGSEFNVDLSGDSMDSFCSLDISENRDSSTIPLKSNMGQNELDPYNSSLSDSECFKSTKGRPSKAVDARTNSDICKHLVSDSFCGETADDCKHSAVNLVAHHCHLFESGRVLAQSLERMNMYRSELSRMSKPNHIVSARMAHFENLSPVSSTVKDLMSSPSSEPSKNVLCGEKLDDSKGKGSYDEKSAAQTEETSSDLESIPLPAGLVLPSDEANNSHHSPTSGVVYRRKTVPASEQDEYHVARRISYLRATAEDRMSDDLELSTEDDDESSEGISLNKDHRIQKLKAFFGEKTPRLKHALHPVPSPEENEALAESSELKSVYGWLICKVVTLEGKRSSDRSWRHVWAILRNNILYLLKERREPSTRSLTCDDHVINIRHSITNVASDYQKRKHVLRLMLLNGTEYLVQAENHSSMMKWLQALQLFSIELTKHAAMLCNSSVLEKAAAYEQQIQSKNRAILQQAHHPVRKLVFRHRSSSESSPTVKTRRASQGDELVLSKIGVIWRDRMVQGWKKVHAGHLQNSSKCASFGVKLEDAPCAVTNEHVPLLVELCAQIVETRGLDVIGIYRVPGNNAAVSLLTETVNQGLENIDLSDTRWNDVNIVSSLLKAYFRKLPEPLLTSHLYLKFILASKVDDPLKRLVAIKKLLQELPVHHYETLRFLMHHLKRVVEHSDVNKMEARNLAIVFGPTLVRARDNNMIAMVTDMSHQCYLIETLITYVDWLFEDHSNTVPFEMSVKDKRKTHPPPTVHSSTLLSNISKLDKSHNDGLQDLLPQEILSSLRNTATRHLRNRNRKKTGEWEAEMACKRSGIVEQDELSCDFTENLKLHETTISNPIAHNSRLPSTPETNVSHTVKEDGCSSLAFELTKKNISYEDRNSVTDSISNDQRVVISDGGPLSNSISDHSCSLESSEIVFHTYDEISALAQEKIRNFERETKALLKRDVVMKRETASKPANIEWEQIEREWQKAKQELEQEDLLDHLADDPSFLSLLLCRGDECYHSDVGIVQDKNSSLNSLSSDYSNLSNAGTKTSSEAAINHNVRKSTTQASSVSAHQEPNPIPLVKEHPCMTDNICMVNHLDEQLHHTELRSIVSGESSSVLEVTSTASTPVNPDKWLETVSETSCARPTKTLTITTTLPLANTVTSFSHSARLDLNIIPTTSTQLPACSKHSSSNVQLNASDPSVEKYQMESPVADDSICDCKADNQLVSPRS